MCRKACVFGALAVTWLATAAGASAEEMSVRATSSQNAISVPGTARITYGLEISAGSEARRFGVRVQPNYVFGEEHGDPEAPPIEAFLSSSRGNDPDFSWEGDLEFEGAQGQEGFVVCGSRGHHGGEVTQADAHFYLPAGGRGKLNVRYDILPVAPWPTTDYRARFTVGPQTRWLGVPGTEVTRPPAPGAVPRVEALPPAPSVNGRRGVRIVLTTDPPMSTNPAFDRSPPGFAPDTLITIAGTTDPPLRNQLIQLEYQTRDQREPQALATVRTDDKGRIRFRAWRPHAEGRYELYARYTSQSPELADDFTCPLGFTIAAGNPAPEMKLDSSSARVKEGVVGLPVRCMGAPPARCTGTLRLTGRGWRRKARYDLAAPSAGAVRIAVGRGGSALLKASPSGPARTTPARRIKLKR